jgi:hypothetical protein
MLVLFLAAVPRELGSVVLDRDDHVNVPILSEGIGVLVLLRLKSSKPEDEQVVTCGGFRMPTCRHLAPSGHTADLCVL